MTMIIAIPAAFEEDCDYLSSLLARWVVAIITDPLNRRFIDGAASLPVDYECPGENVGANDVDLRRAAETEIVAQAGAATASSTLVFWHDRWESLINSQSRSGGIEW